MGQRLTRNTTPVPVLVDDLDPNPNLNDTPYAGDQIIDFLDYSEMANEWLVGPLLFPDDLP